ncbi:hypothetical protein I4U23_019816 [Adineta vaga]|nr:hypothetical protein I4U23_019816 [Adineta vaga]
MHSFSSIIFCFLILFSWNQLTNGLACYSCTNCNDPFNPTYVLVRYENDTTTWYCTKSWVSNNIVRSIATSCTQSSTVGSSQTCCQSNLCNNAQRYMLTKTFSFSIGILMLIVFF